MSTKQQPIRKSKSKRERRVKIAVYVMIAAMLLSTMTAGLAYFF